MTRWLRPGRFGEAVDSYTRAIEIAAPHGRSGATESGCRARAIPRLLRRLCPTTCRCRAALDAHGRAGGTQRLPTCARARGRSATPDASLAKSRNCKARPGSLRSPRRRLDLPVHRPCRVRRPIGNATLPSLAEGFRRRIHGRLAVRPRCVVHRFPAGRSGGTYTSFCNVNSQVNCDCVLTSRSRKVFGVPLAWFAVLAHAATRGRAHLLPSAGAVTSAHDLALASSCLGGIGSAVFSAYMAFLSFAVLQTVCLMCMGMYAGGGGPARRWRSCCRGAFAEHTRPDTTSFLATRCPQCAAAMFLLTAAFGRFAWSGGLAPAGRRGTNLEQLRNRTRSSMIGTSRSRSANREQRARTTRQLAAPVVIVEFSDFECAPLSTQSRADS